MSSTETRSTTPEIVGSEIHGTSKTRVKIFTKRIFASLLRNSGTDKAGMYDIDCTCGLVLLNLNETGPKIIKATITI